MLQLTARLDARLRQAVEEFDYNTYTRLISDFANNDLSAFYIDIRKDLLYCAVNPATGRQYDTRRAYRTVLDMLFHALVRWLAPVLVFTTEEVWGTRFPDAGSVHLLEWPDDPLLRFFRGDGNPAEENPVLDEDNEFLAKWAKLRELRTQVTEAIEPLRRDKVIGSSLEAEVTVPELLAPAEVLAELFIVSSVKQGDAVTVAKTTFEKCGRCWRYLPEVSEDGALCGRCEDVLND
jgi:isoleucyl-tRNA synthetase